MLTRLEKVKVGTFLRHKLLTNPTYRDLVDDIGITSQIEPEYMLDCLLQDLNRDEILDVLALGLNSSVADHINKLVDIIDAPCNFGKSGVSA